MEHAARVLDESLKDVAKRYGDTAAYGVALTLEYPTTSYGRSTYTGKASARLSPSHWEGAGLN